MKGFVDFIIFLTCRMGDKSFSLTFECLGLMGDSSSGVSLVSILSQVFTSK